MKIYVNGEPKEITDAMLDVALAELGYGEARVATAVNETFVPVAARPSRLLEAGDRLEILSPRQGG